MDTLRALIGLEFRGLVKGIHYNGLRITADVCGRTLSGYLEFDLSFLGALSHPSGESLAPSLLAGSPALMSIVGTNPQNWPNITKLTNSTPSSNSSPPNTTVDTTSTNNPLEQSISMTSGEGLGHTSLDMFRIMTRSSSCPPSGCNTPATNDSQSPTFQATTSRNSPFQIPQTQNNKRRYVRSGLFKKDKNKKYIYPSEFRRLQSASLQPISEAPSSDPFNATRFDMRLDALDLQQNQRSHTLPSTLSDRCANIAALTLAHQNPPLNTNPFLIPFTQDTPTPSTPLTPISTTNSIATCSTMDNIEISNPFSHHGFGIDQFSSNRPAATRSCSASISTKDEKLNTVTAKRRLSQPNCTSTHLTGISYPCNGFMSNTPNGTKLTFMTQNGGFNGDNSSPNLNFSTLAGLHSGVSDTSSESGSIGLSVYSDISGVVQGPFPFGSNQGTLMLTPGAGILSSNLQFANTNNGNNPTSDPMQLLFMPSTPLAGLLMQQGLSQSSNSPFNFDQLQFDYRLGAGTDKSHSCAPPFELFDPNDDSQSPHHLPSSGIDYDQPSLWSDGVCGSMEE